MVSYLLKFFITHASISFFFSVICYILIKTIFIIFLINESSNGSNLDPLGVYTYSAFITLVKHVYKRKKLKSQ